jgi:threonine/homoserine/homoserine lactone efflux protein
MLAFLAGLIAGIILSAPIGPMGALAAYHAARQHVRAALMLAVGACMADSLLALMASLGATSLPVPDAWLHLAIAILMGGMGVYLWFNKPGKLPSVGGSATLMVGFGGTILHVGNLLAFGLAFGWLHRQGLVLEQWLPRVALVVGVFCGALTMWWGLIVAAKRLGDTEMFQRFEQALLKGLAIGCLLTAAWAFGKLL